MNKVQKMIVLSLSVLVFGFLLYADNSNSESDPVTVTVYVSNTDATTVTATPKDGGQGDSSNVCESNFGRYAELKVTPGYEYTFSDGCGASETFYIDEGDEFGI